MEGLFSTNNYNMPKVITGKEEIAVLLIRLIVLEPGSNPLHPEMGVGLLQRYKNCLTEDIPDLEKEIKDQILVYLPLYQQATIKITVENAIMKISISIDDTLYIFTTSSTPANGEITLTGLK